MLARLAVAPGDVANFNLFTWWASSYSGIFCRLKLEDYRLSAGLTTESLTVYLMYKVTLGRE